MQESTQRRLSGVGVLGGLRFALGLASGALALAGCSDNRITIDELRSLEKEVSEVEPVQIESNALELTDMRPYKVGVGDTLSVTLVGLTENPYTPIVLRLRVYDDGTVQMPLVGGVVVAGLALPAAERAIISAHVPSVVKEGLSCYCELVGPENTTVLVMGAAGQRGLVTLPSNERNVLYALMHSLGYSPGTSGKVHVHPVKLGEPEQTYNLTDVNDLRRALMAPPLQSGDMVVVESAPSNVIYVIGLVNSPTPVGIPPDTKLSAVRAIASSGGLIDFLEPEEATLWRKLPNGQQVRVKLALLDMMQGKTPDVDLLAGDVLEIPHTAKTRVREWVQRNVLFGPFRVDGGVSMNYDPLAERRFDRLNESDSDFSRSVLDTIRLGLPDLIIPPVTPIGP